MNKLSFHVAQGFSYTIISHPFCYRDSNWSSQLLACETQSSIIRNWSRIVSQNSILCAIFKRICISFSLFLSTVALNGCIFYCKMSTPLYNDCVEVQHFYKTLCNSDLCYSFEFNDFGTAATED